MTLLWMPLPIHVQRGRLKEITDNRTQGVTDMPGGSEEARGQSAGILRRDSMAGGGGKTQR